MVCRQNRVWNFHVAKFLLAYLFSLSYYIVFLRNAWTVLFPNHSNTHYMYLKFFFFFLGGGEHFNIDLSRRPMFAWWGGGVIFWNVYRDAKITLGPLGAKSLIRTWYHRSYFSNCSFLHHRRSSRIIVHLFILVHLTSSFIFSSSFVSSSSSSSFISYHRSSIWSSSFISHHRSAVHHHYSSLYHRRSSDIIIHPFIIIITVMKLITDKLFYYHYH